MIDLERFLSDDDRQGEDRAPFFVGRERELASFQDALSFAAEGRTKGKTLVFQGAPGAGKTALMLECAGLADQTNGEGKRDARYVCVSLEPNQLGSVDGLFGVVHEAIRQQAPKVAGRTAAFLTGLAARGISVGGFGLGPERSGDLDAVSKLQKLEPAWEGLIVLLLVDEAQNIRKTEVTEDVVQYLHAGTKNSTVLLACFGLSDTTDTLVQLGISRTSLKRHHNIGRLALEEARRSISQAFEAFQIHGRTKRRQEWLARLAEASQGWPQHLRILTQAALRELKEHGRNLADADLNAALATGEAAKRRYYGHRLTATGPWQEACKVMARALEGRLLFTGRELQQTIAPFQAEQLAAEGRPAPFSDFLSKAIHAGVLSQTAPDAYSVPIPSFARYLREEPGVTAE